MLRVCLETERVALGCKRCETEMAKQMKTKKNENTFYLLNLKRKNSEKTVKSQRLWSRADLNRRPLAQEAHSLKNLRSIRTGYLRVEEYRWKKINQTISVTATDNLYQHCACKRSLRTEAKLSFRAF